MSSLASFSARLSQQGAILRWTGRPFWGRHSSLEVGTQLTPQLPVNWRDKVEALLVDLTPTSKGRHVELEPGVECSVLAASGGVLVRISEGESTTQVNTPEELILDSHPVATFSVFDELICYANEAAALLIGAPDPTQVVGLPFEQVFPHHKLSDVVPEALTQVVEVTLLDFASRHRRVRLRGVEKNGGYVLACSAEEEPMVSRAPDKEGRLAGLGMLVAGVAHEINNPLTFVLPALKDSLTLIEQGKGVHAKEQLVDTLRDCLTGVERVAKIASDLREFRRGTEEISRVDVNEVVMQTVHMAEERLGEKIRIHHVLGPPCETVANSTRLGQVILNLILNAAQAMPADLPGCWVGVRTWEIGEHVYVAVEDNGAGIEKDKLSSIFDPFYSTKHAGTGLGLSVCAGIVKRLGGWIEVDSTPGKGSVFTVVLPHAEGAMALSMPLEQPRKPKVAKVIEKVEPPSAPKNENFKTQLLVVDDEPLVLRSVKRMLGRQAEITQATGGWEAIRLLQAGLVVNRVICDMVMQEGSGEDVWTWIKENRPDLKPCFCFMTGMAPPSSPDPTLPPVIHKPFSLDDLEEALGGELI